VVAGQCCVFYRRAARTTWTASATVSGRARHHVMATTPTVTATETPCPRSCLASFHQRQLLMTHFGRCRHDKNA